MDPEPLGDINSKCFKRRVTGEDKQHPNVILALSFFALRFFMISFRTVLLLENGSKNSRLGLVEIFHQRKSSDGKLGV